MPTRNEAIIEGILFACGEPVSIDEIAAVLDTGHEEAELLITQLMNRYAEEERGIRILRLEDRFQMTTDQSVFDSLIKLVSRPRRYRLTESLLETLAIIAYRQPVTRAEIERIRGAGCTHAIDRLTEYGLIEEAGRLQQPGRPMTFKTTDEFFRYFPIGTLDGLPDIDLVKEEQLQQEVLEEVGAFDKEG